MKTSMFSGLAAGLGLGALAEVTKRQLGVAKQGRDHFVFNDQALFR